MPVDSSLVGMLQQQAGGDAGLLSSLLSDIATDGRLSVSMVDNILGSRKEWQAKDLANALELVVSGTLPSLLAPRSSEGSSGGSASSVANSHVSNTVPDVSSARAAEWQRQEAAWFAESENHVSISKASNVTGNFSHSSRNNGRNCNSTSSGSGIADRSESSGGSIPAASAGIALTSYSLAMPAVPTHDPASMMMGRNLAPNLRPVDSSASEATDRAIAEALAAADQQQGQVDTIRQTAADIEVARELAARDEAELAASRAAAEAVAAADEADAAAAAARAAVEIIADHEVWQRDRDLAEALAAEEAANNALLAPSSAYSTSSLSSSRQPPAPTMLGLSSIPGVAALTTAANSVAASAAAAIFSDIQSPTKVEPIMYRQYSGEVECARGLQRHDADASDNASDLLAVANATSDGRLFTDPDFGLDAPLLTAMPDNYRAPSEETEGLGGGGSGNTTNRWDAWHRPSDIEVDAGTGARREATHGFLGHGGGISWTLFGDPAGSDGAANPLAADVQQGALGDCWFLSALSVLAEYQGGRLIRRLFPGDQGPGCSRNGAYVVKLCAGGQWQDVLIDDFFPTRGGLHSGSDRSSNHIFGSSTSASFFGLGQARTLRQFSFAGTRGGRLWAALVEKAYAKLCGGYLHLKGGETSEALHVLTGWPTETVELEASGAGSNSGDSDTDEVEVDLLWSTLLSACEAGHVLCASTGDGNEALHTNGLLSNHAYAIVRVVELTDPFTGAAHRLLKLRNPHGRGLSWRGDWSQGSPLWTPELRAAVSNLFSPSVSHAATSEDTTSDGSFWLCLHDLRLCFREVVTCRCTERGWSEDRVAGSLEAPQPGSGGAATLDAWALEVYAHTEAVINVAQLPARLNSTGQSDLAVLVLKAPDSFSDSISGSDGALPESVSLAAWQLHASSKATVKTSNSLSTWLRPGRYLVVPLGFNHMAAMETRAVTMAVFSAQFGSVALSSKYRLPPAAQRFVTCMYATDAQRAKVTHWNGATISTRNDGCLLLTHVSLDAGRFGGFASGVPPAVQITTTVSNARHMIHGRAGCRGNGNVGSDAGGLEEHGNEFTTVDIVCPGMQQLVCVAVPVLGAYSYRTSFQYKTLPGYGSRLSVGSFPPPHTPPVPSPSSLFASRPIDT